MLKAFSAAVALLLLSTTASATDSQCAALKELAARQTITDAEKSRFIEDLRRLVSADNLCSKNLFGRLTYQGKFLPKDIERAYAVFLDVANKGYPPAMYNLAYFYIEQKTLPPEGVLDLLKGMMVRFAGDPKWGTISADARELGWEYLDTLLMKEPSSRHLRSLERDFAEISNATVLQAAQIAIDTRNSYHAAGNVIIGIMALGAAASMASNALSARAPVYSSTYTLPPPSPKYFSLMSTPTPGVFYLYSF